jgi:hypothetical protein
VAETDTRRPRLGAKLIIALLAGLVVIAALLPTHGVDSDPPVCWSMFDYVVPCGSWMALAAGAAAAALVGIVLWHGRPSETTAVRA